MSAAFSWERTPYGRGAWLVRFAERPGDAAFERGRAIDHYLERHAPAGVAWVVAFTTVLLEIERADVAIDPLVAALSTAIAPPPGPSHEIPVVYDGEDLPALAASCGLTPAEVVRLHAEPEYRVYALGFSPGFPYLGELDARLHAPRRATPRERVPAGSVAIGGEHTGIYPLEGPGGWNLLGRTPVPILDPGKNGDDAFLLRAGDRVRFVAVGDAPRLPAPAAASPVSAEDAAVEIVAAGMANWIRDAPRPARFRRFGVPPGGAMNPVAAARANALVGNPPDAPLLEVLIGGIEIQACRAIDIAITSSTTGERRTLARGERARVRTSREGLWCYLALAGGIAAERRLGSASHGPRNAWGPRLERGVRLAAGRAAVSAPAEAIPETAGSDSPLRIWRGPQWETFDARTRDRFLSSEWTVTRAIDRIGYRLAGPVLESPAVSLASEPVRTGTVQVPPDGQPIAIMPDGPTIGGYAKIAWIEPDDLVRLAETRPGRRVRFRLTEGP